MRSGAEFARMRCLTGMMLAVALAAASATCASAAQTYAPYADGLTWRFHCTPTDGAAFDLSETFHARGTSGALQAFALAISRNGEAPVVQSLHGVDAAGNGYLVGTYQNGTLHALATPALTVPANPAPGFTVRYNRLDEQVVRRYVKETNLRGADGSTFHAVLYADETGTGSATYAYAPGVGLVLSNTIPRNGDAVLCQRRS